MEVSYVYMWSNIWVARISAATAAASHVVDLEPWCTTTLPHYTLTGWAIYRLVKSKILKWLLFLLIFKSFLLVSLLRINLLSLSLLTSSCLRFVQLWLIFVYFAFIILAALLYPIVMLVLSFIHFFSGAIPSSIQQQSDVILLPRRNGMIW